MVGLHEHALVDLGHQGRLADAGVSDDDDLEDVVVVPLLLDGQDAV